MQPLPLPLYILVFKVLTHVMHSRSARCTSTDLHVQSEGGKSQIDWFCSLDKGQPLRLGIHMQTSKTEEEQRTQRLLQEPVHK